MPQVVLVSSLGPQGPVGPQGPIGPTGSFDSVTGSFTTTASFNAFTSSYNTASFTGSFVGSGAGLFNIPASGITGLNLSQIATGSISASVSTGTGSFTISSGSSNFFFVSSSGRVGIGTTSPSSPLHIKNSAPSYLGGLILEKSDASLTYNLYVDGSNSFAVSKGASQFFTVDQSGNAGIGISSPTAKLQVKGSGTTSSTTALLVQNSDNTSNFSIKDNGDLTSNNNFVTINSYDATINGANKVAINGTNFGTGYIYRGVSTGFLILGNDSTVSTGITLYGSTHATLRDSIRINQSGSTIVTIVSGSVGIGTTTPTYKLHVSGSGNFTNNLTVTGSLTLTGALTASSAIISGDVIIQGTASVNTLIVNQTQLSTGSNQLGDAANDTQTLYGSVIIPTGSLTVTGSQAISGSVTATGTITGQVLRSADSLGRNVTITGTNNTTINWSNGQFDIQNSGTTVSRYNGAGGIGYFVTKLNINVPNVITDLGAALGVRGSGATSSTTALLVQNANASSSLAVLDNGYVGIGTSSPAYNLDVSGSIRSTSDLFINGSFRLRYDANNNASLFGGINFTTGTNNLVIGTATGFNINSGGGNTLLGHNAGQGLYSGTGNTFVGWRTGGSINPGNAYNSFLGYEAGRLADTSYSVFLGYQAGYSEATTNKLYIANSSTATPLIGGDFSRGRVGINVPPTGISASLHIVSQTTSSLSSSLLIQNSGSTRTLSYTEDGTLTLSNGIYTTKWYMGSSYVPTLEFSSQGTILWGTGNSLNFLGGGVDYRIGFQNSFATTNASMSFSAGHKGFFNFVTIGTTTTYNAIGSIFSDNSNSGLILNYKSAGVDTEGIRLTNTGLVGIGTTAPTAKLQVKGSGTTSSTTALLVQNSSAQPALTVKDDKTATFGGDIFTANDSTLSGSFGYSGGDYIRIHGLNNGGQAKFASYDYGTQRTAEIAFGSGDIHWRGLYKLSTNGYYLTDSVGSLGLFERFTVDYLGRVGISNPNPAYRLDVSGSGNFTNTLTVTGSVIIDNGLFDTVSTGSIPTGSTLVYSFSTASYQAGFFDYYASSGSNFRAGTIMSVAGAGTYKFTDQATPDIGSTTNLQFSMSLATSNLQLYASASSAGWTVKTTFRTI